MKFGWHLQRPADSAIHAGRDFRVRKRLIFQWLIGHASDSTQFFVPRITFLVTSPKLNYITKSMDRQTRCGTLI